MSYYNNQTSFCGKAKNHSEEVVLTTIQSWKNAFCQSVSEPLTCQAASCTHCQDTKSRPSSWHLLTQAPQEAMRLWKRNTQHRAQGLTEQSLTANCFASVGALRQPHTPTAIWGGTAQPAQVKEIENHHEVINMRSSITYGGETLVQEQKVWEFEGSREENKGKGRLLIGVNLTFTLDHSCMYLLFCCAMNLNYANCKAAVLQLAY